MARGVRSEEFPVPEKLCRAHLERVAASATFARAGQLRALLEWLGGRSLAPAGLPPTEREIAEEVLGRADFDPQADSLVRKEISRLRQKLAQYYGREGARDRIHIHCRGGYLLRFVWADRRMETRGVLPCILILPFRSDAELRGHALDLAEELAVRLGELGRAELVSPTTALSYLGRVGDIRSFASECGADYVVEGSLESGDDYLRATLWFVDGHTGRTERPGRFEGEDSGDIARLAALWLQEQVVRFLE
jgi:TolB-like protein